MIKSLLSILNVVEGEEKPVLLLLGYGFFMGVFLAAYKIVATTLFLNNLSEYIKEAFFISGLLGVITTWIYAKLQGRVHYSNLIIFNIVSIFIFIAGARWMFEFYNAQWLVFTFFVMLGPITSLLILGFWGIFGRLFDNVGQSKRIGGGIDSGQLMAIIITTFSIPFIIPYIADITNILLIGEVGLAISVVFFILLYKNFTLSSYHKKHKEVRKETSFRNIFKSKYIIYLSMYLFLSMAAFVFVDFSFLNVIEQQYPNERQLASFLGVFEGSIMVLSLLMQTFVNEKLLTMYGIKTSLLLLPLILFLFTAMAISAGYFIGFDVSSTTFIWFFLFIALSKLFVTTLREATESPVFKLFFMPLDSRVRFDIQAKVEGTVNELSRAISGGLILLFGLIPAFSLIHYSWLLGFIIIIWVILLFKINTLYKFNIKQKLVRLKEEADKLEQRGRNLLVNRLFSSIDTYNPGLMLFALRALSKIAPETFKSKIEEIKNDHTLVSSTRVLQTLESDFSFIHIDNLKNFEKQDTRQRSGDKIGKAAFEEEISELVKSANKVERKLAADLITQTGAEENVSLLIELITDTDPGVVKAAMKSAAELKKQELLPFILDNLLKTNYRDTVVEVLINYGELTLPHLEKIFYNSERNVNVKKDIVNIYGKIGGEEAIEFLWKKIDFPDKNVVLQVLLSLSLCEFSASEDQVQRIKYFIEEDIANIVLNLKAIEQLKAIDAKEFRRIIESLKEENDHNSGHIYMLLSMIYDQKSIQLVKENLKSHTSDGTSYAIELMDVFLSEDLKQKIIPILDDISDLDRIRRLEMFYPFIEISLDELIRQIINKEYNSINRWTKVSMIYFLGKERITEKYDMELIANLFNPDQLIKEISAWAMNEVDEQLFNENIDRLEYDDKNHLQNLIQGQNNHINSDMRPHMLFEAVNFLKDKTLLGDMPSYILAGLVDFMDQIFLEDKTIIEPEEWQNDCFYLISKGSLEIKKTTGEVIDQFEEGDFLGEQINIDLLEDQVSFGVVGDTVLLKIEKNKFFELITNEYEVTLKLLDSFNIQSEISLLD